MSFFNREIKTKSVTVNGKEYVLKEPSAKVIADYWKQYTLEYNELKESDETEGATVTNFDWEVFTLKQRALLVAVCFFDPNGEHETVSDLATEIVETMRDYEEELEPIYEVASELCGLKSLGSEVQSQQEDSQEN